MADKKNSNNTPSPLNREQLVTVCGGMPKKLSVEERFANNQPPKVLPKEPITVGSAGLKS